MTEIDSASGFAIFSRAKSVLGMDAPKAKPMTEQDKKRLSILEACSRGIGVYIGGMPALERETGISWNDLENLGKLTFEQLRTVFAELYDGSSIDAEYNIINAPNKDRNKPKKVVRNVGQRVDALSDLLNEPDYDHAIAIENGDPWTAERLNSASRMVARDREQMKFHQVNDDIVSCENAATFHMLYHLRLSKTRGYDSMLENLFSKIKFLGDARDYLADAPGQLLGFKYLASGAPGRLWLCGPNGALVAWLRAIEDGFEVDRKKLKAALDWVELSIAGKTTVEVLADDAATVIYARCRVVGIGDRVR